MSHFDTALLVFAGVVLVFGIIVLIKPDIGWMWRIGRWVVRDAKPSEYYILASRIDGIIAIVAAVIMFVASINTSR